MYIERILVTENIADGRQYLFQCAKWLDSGQVDGEIERTLKTTAFCYLTTASCDSKSSSRIYSEVSKFASSTLVDKQRNFWLM